jgi:signal transduction histidine kinase/CheY-like chemotaxis protein
VHPEDRERVAQAWATSLRERRNHEIEHRVITPNGEARWVHERCETRFDRAGEPVESVGTATDITARRLAEQDQEQMRQRLAATERMESVGRLTGGIAHDFNNMLGVILGRVQLALESLPADHVARDDLREALDAANRSADLARQLLAFSRRRPAVPVRVQLNAHIPGLLRMLERLLGEGITLLWSACPRGCPVRVDPSHLDQVITNLCVNARDAMKGVGELHLSTECSYRQGPDGREQRYVTLAVRDTGCGMSPEVLARAFEPFFTTKGPGQGTGLGLATVHSIVEQAGGAVEVRSRPGEGALFRIHLPADEGPDAEEDAPGEGRAGPTGLEAPATVLVVEDEEAVMRLTCRMLQSLGYQVLSASSPNRALALLRTERPKLDLVLTDTIMPEMTGPELAEVLRREAPGLPVVFMSGYTADVLAPHGVIEEGIHFIAKPFSSAELHTTLQAVLHSAARIR